MKFAPLMGRILKSLNDSVRSNRHYHIWDGTKRLSRLTPKWTLRRWSAAKAWPRDRSEWPVPAGDPVPADECGNPAIPAGRVARLSSPAPGTTARTKLPMLEYEPGGMGRDAW